MTEPLGKYELTSPEWVTMLLHGAPSCLGSISTTRPGFEPLEDRDRR
jgi:hypothetical protein